MSLSSFLPIIITVAGLWMICKIRAVLFLHPMRCFGCLKYALREKESRKSLALALAGTLGVGNIIGVAVGLSIGGAGCVPWMMISSIFSAVLKFSEASLSSEISHGSCGGMIYVIRNSFAKGGALLSIFYAVLCLALAFFMGAALQVSSAVECMKSGSNFSEEVFFVIMIVCLLWVISNGISSIENFTSVAIPMSTIIYICLAFFCVCANLQRVPAVMSDMMIKAFSLNGIGGGAIGIFSSKIISEGYCRGLLSNEAGAGTSTLAHSRNSNAEPCEVGMLGVCEVIFDTVVLCFITALSVLVSVDSPQSYESGVALIMDSIGCMFGGIARFPVLACIIVFAFSTVVCWYYYGSECYRYIFKSKNGVIYTIFFLIATFVGYIIKVEFLVKVSDSILVFLTAISCATVIKNSGKVKSLAGDMLT